MKLTFIFLVVLLTAQLIAQTPSVLSEGYAAPTPPLKVAPGQVTTLFVSGVRTRLTRPFQATQLPLPASVEGISLSIEYTLSSRSQPVPIFKAYQSDDGLTAVTVQIPLELELPVITGGPGPVDTPVLVLTEAGTKGKPIPLMVTQDRVHVIQTPCDTGFFAQPADLYADFCKAPIVTHADGTTVKESSPAKSGETVVMYVFGLGRVSIPVKSGEPSPQGATLDHLLFLRFEFLPGLPLTSTPADAAAPIPGPLPVFAGLAPGLVGLYQVNFVVPELPEGTPSCGGADAAFLVPNVTVRLMGQASSDGAAICVRR